MSNSTTGRVSKGVFVFKGKKKTADCAEYFNSGSDPGDNESRLQLCLDLLERTQEKIQLMQSELNTRLFEDLVVYVRDAHKHDKEGPEGTERGTDRSTDHSTISYTRHEVPTAALVTGVNTPDHDMIFSQLVTMVRDRVTPHVALLHSKDCTNVKTIMTATISQLMGHTDMDDDDEECVLPSSGQRINATMSVLTSWYKYINKTKLPQSPRKRKASDSPPKSPQSPRKSAQSPRKCAQSPRKLAQSPRKSAQSPRKAAQSPGKSAQSQRKQESKPRPVVVILEDFESFVPSVVQDFITICSTHLSEIPFVFILGVATTVTAIHQLLPQHVSSRLCLQKFQAPPASDCLTQVIQQVLLAPEFPFKLGGKVFHLLVDIFLYHDFSTLKFLQAFQCALLDHFTQNPASVACVLQTDIDTTVDHFSHTQLNQIRSLHSFRRHVEKQAAEDQINLLEDDQYTKSEICTMLEGLYDYNSCMLPVLQCLHCMVSRLPGQPLGHKIREMYGTLLHQNICELPEYPEVLSMLKALSRDEMVNKLGQCIGFLTADHSPDMLGDIVETLTTLQHKFQNIEQLMQQQDDSVSDQPEPELTSPNRRVSLAKKMDLAQLKQSLQEDFDRKKKKMSVYEQTRQDTVDYLHVVFKRYLLTPTLLPLHEVMYYNRVAAIKSCITGVPRSNLEHALADPYYYLQVEEMRSDGMTILPTLPDVCIAYKLHRECGRLINLYDWLQAFVMIVRAAQDNDENVADFKKSEQLLQARFIRAVSELQFLGFIKSTKRKTDHVARLTWGAC